MLNFRRKQTLGKRRRQVGPVIIAVLFLLAACGISLDFFAGQILQTAEIVNSVEEADNLPSLATIESEADSNSVATAPDQNEISETRIDVTSTGEIDRSALPPSDSLSSAAGKRVRPVGRQPSSEEDDDSVGIVRNRQYGTPDIDLDTKEEDYKISLAPNRWKGNAQLLPNPMFVSQLYGKRRVEIRGGGWVAIDIVKSQIIPVELYRGKSGAKPVIEAKRLDGREIVTPSNTGFPIVRGISDLRIGSFEVFENPPCMTRFGGVTEDEVCEITLRGTKIRYRFEAPVIAPDAQRPEGVLSTVSIDTGLGQWLQIASFNENFYPIGDANRDGYPDFFAESVTGSDESGVQTLFVSHLHDDTVEYVSYAVPFKSAR